MNLLLFDLKLLRKFKPQTMYLGDHTALATTRLGNKIYLDTRDISLTPHLLMQGAWENPLARVMIANFRPGGVMLDAGANVGYHTLLMAHIGGLSARFIAVEANPRLAELVRRTLAVNGIFERSSIHAVALGPKSGEVELRIWNSYLGSSSLISTDESAEYYGDKLIRLTVPMKTLDELTGGQPLSSAKIDCEGAEPGIIAGGSATLRASNNLMMVIEYSPAMYGPGDAATMLDALTGHGFKFSRIQRDGDLVPVTRDNLLNAPEQLDLMVYRDIEPVSAKRAGFAGPVIRVLNSWRNGG
jgi:FkbM family methyltransferase